MGDPALEVVSVPLRPTSSVHHAIQSWGSESANIPFGYYERPKPRWQQIAHGYQDAAALDRFGIDPTRPAGPNIIMNANAYGVPIDGFTTGYSVKLPPANIGIQNASTIPRSGNQPVTVGNDNGTGTAVDPVNELNAATYGASSGRVAEGSNLNEILKNVVAQIRGGGARSQFQGPSASIIQ